MNSVFDKVPCVIQKELTHQEIIDQVRIELVYFEAIMWVICEELLKTARFRKYCKVKDLIPGFFASLYIVLYKYYCRLMV